MFNKILIATDNSKLMEGLIPYTATLFPQAEFHVISVINTSSGNIPVTNLLKKTLTNLSEDAVNKAEKTLTDMGIKKLNKSTPSGEPSREILTYAKDNDIDLCVLATHSKSGTQKIHIGHVCRIVLEHIHCPVMLINKPPKQERPKRILNPTSGSKYSHRASIFAATLANNFKAEMTTLYFGKSSRLDEEMEFVKNITDSINVKVNREFCEGDPEECIVKRAKDHDLIIASRGHSGLTYKLRSIIPEFALSKLDRAIIAQVTIPFLIHAR